MAQPTSADSASRWGSLLARLSPVPRFPEPAGPYTVGTVDVEIPVAELESPAPAPSAAAADGIDTVLFRVFYPCEPSAKAKRISWLPNPQREHLAAYLRFLGAGPRLAGAASFLPRHVHYTSIPALENASLLPPSRAANPLPNCRWPTVIFSHGLGGSRNAYSALATGLAAHGAVVFCPESRDGSAVVSYVRGSEEQGRRAVAVPYQSIPHAPAAEVHPRRDAQLRLRCWELGLTFGAALALDAGRALGNRSPGAPPAEVLRGFRGALRVHEPGAVAWAGHSFGAAAVAQFLKSVFHAGRAGPREPLYAPARDSALVRQVTPRSPTVLLDMWCFPLLSRAARPLFDLPLPAYADGGGGRALLAVESDHFYRWTEHLHTKARLLSPDPRRAVVSADLFGGERREPNFFVVRRSAHLNQSDFGVLFPWLTSKVFGSDNPEQTLRLNIRAILQSLRESGVPVAETGPAALVDGAGAGAQGEKGEGDGAILDRSGRAGVEAWEWVGIVGRGRVVDDHGKIVDGDKAVEDHEPEMAGVIEPSVSREAGREIEAEAEARRQNGKKKPT
ncbi:platelet-activating factor acetylhydrolase, isoform II-domain-containing protein [Xylariomycetidae sp. FL0641]|nr:platelet-activating factor acetylhydrolase, isoform II-domain-containing protein [Xylariomycetidae sp. FL0641]